MTPVHYAIPAVLAALLGGACWRLITLRRALIRERVVARLDQAAAHRELQNTYLADQVLAAAAAVIDDALAGTDRSSNRPRKGGTDA